MSLYAQALGALFAALGLSFFDDNTEDAKRHVEKQKATVAANLKKAGFAQSTIIENQHVLLATTISDEKAKALATALDRVAPIAFKALKFDEKDAAWKGKLAIYYLPVDADFKTFMRSVVVAQPKGTHYSISADEPFVVDPADGPAGSTEDDRLAGAMAIVAGAYLKARVSGAELPDWILGGFGRVTALRALGLNAKRYVAYRTAARRLATKGAKPTELWAEAPPADSETLANSFMEYLAYGPGAANFAKLTGALKTDEIGNAPSVPAAFEAAGWKDLGALEIAWRKWAAVVR